MKIKKKILFINFWPVMSSHKLSRALMWTQEHSWVWCNGGMITLECDERPYPLGAMFMTAFELSWVVIAAWRQDPECSRLLLSVHWQSWALMASLGCLWVLMGTLLMSAQDFSWAPFMRSHEHSWGWHNRVVSTHESSRAVMSLEDGAMGPLAFISTYECWKY